MSTFDLVAECAWLMSSCGPDHAKVTEFVRRHQSDSEFVGFASLSHDLKEIFVRRKRRVKQLRPGSQQAATTWSATSGRLHKEL